MPPFKYIINTIILEYHPKSLHPLDNQVCHKVPHSHVRSYLQFLSSGQVRSSYIILSLDICTYTTGLENIKGLLYKPA